MRGKAAQRLSPPFFKEIPTTSIFVLMVNDGIIAAFSTAALAHAAGALLEGATLHEAPFDPPLPAGGLKFYRVEFTSAGSFINLSLAHPDTIVPEVHNGYRHLDDARYIVNAWGSEEGIIPYARQLLLDHLAKPAKS